MAKTLVKLRGHHMERLRVFYLDGSLERYHPLEIEEGHSPDFCEGEIALFNLLIENRDQKVKICNGPDDLCRFCNKNRISEGCSGLELATSDQELALNYDLEVNRTYTVKEILMKFDELN